MKRYLIHFDGISSCEPTHSMSFKGRRLHRHNLNRKILNVYRQLNIADSNTSETDNITDISGSVASLVVMSNMQGQKQNYILL